MQMYHEKDKQDQFKLQQLNEKLSHCLKEKSMIEREYKKLAECTRQLQHANERAAFASNTDRNKINQKEM